MFISNGNGTLGILEGPASEINFDGSQKYRYWVRVDVQGEVAYAMSAAARFLDKPIYDSVAAHLLDFLFYVSNLRGGEKRDSTCSAFGLIGWAVTHPGVFYGDDNARCMSEAIVFIPVILTVPGFVLLTIRIGITGLLMLMRAGEPGRH